MSARRKARSTRESIAILPRPLSGTVDTRASAESPGSARVMRSRLARRTALQNRESITHLTTVKGQGFMKGRRSTKRSMSASSKLTADSSLPADWSVVAKSSTVGRDVLASRPSGPQNVRCSSSTMSWLRRMMPACCRSGSESDPAPFHSAFLFTAVRDDAQCGCRPRRC